jgi:hypothetical protein
VILFSTANNAQPVANIFNDGTDEIARCDQTCSSFADLTVDTVTGPGGPGSARWRLVLGLAQSEHREMILV